MCPMMSGERITSRIASAALRRCVASLVKFSMLKPATVNSPAARHRHRNARSCPPLADGGASGSTL